MTSCEHVVSIGHLEEAMYWAMLADPELREDSVNLASILRLAISGAAAALPVNVLNRFQERFGVSICEG